MSHKHRHRQKMTEEQLFSGDWLLDVAVYHGEIQTQLKRYVTYSEDLDSSHIYELAKSKFRTQKPYGGGDKAVAFYYSGPEDPITLEINRPDLIAHILKSGGAHPPRVTLKISGGDRMFQAQQGELPFGPEPGGTPATPDLVPTQALMALLSASGVNRDTVKLIKPYDDRPHSRFPEESAANVERVNAVMAAISRQRPGHRMGA